MRTLKTFVVITRGFKRNRREVYAAKSLRHAAELAARDGATVIAVENLDTGETYTCSAEE